MNRFYTLRTPFYSPDDFGGGAPSSPAASDISAPATPATPAAQTPDPTGTPNPGTAAAPTQQTQPEPSWLRGRLQETRQSAERAAEQRFQAQLAEERAQREAIQRQLHALVGVGPTEDPEIATVRAQFNKLYPGLAQLEEHAADLIALREARGDIDAVSQHHWNSYGQQSMERLYAAAQATYGSPLSDQQKIALHSMLTGFVSSNPDAAQAYASNPNFINEFWGMISGNFIDPARRAATASVPAAPPRIPQDTPAGIPSAQQPAKPASLDERANNAWASYLAHRTRNNPVG